MKIRVVWFLIALAVYCGVPRLTGERFPVRGHFPQMARCFLDGRLSIPASETRDRSDELIPSADGERFHYPYPPLPAVLLMPFVWLFGGAVTIQTACRVASAVNVVLLDACLVRLPHRLGHPAPMTRGSRFVLDALFAFGTAAWHNSDMAGDWHYAHAAALGCMLLALREYVGKNRPAWLGAFVALAILTRPTAALTGVFFLFPLLRARQATALVSFLIGPAVGVAVLAGYNMLRFGDPMDFGYSRMRLVAAGRQVMETFGQFHPHFLFRNFFWFFLAPPTIVWRRLLPYPAYDPHGTGMFFVTPALLYIFAALGRSKRSPIVRDAFWAMALCLVPLLLYFNTGFWQFGHRFSMDYLHLLMLLLVIGIGPRPSRTAHVLIVLSIAIQACGVLFNPVAFIPKWMAPLP